MALNDPISELRSVTCHMGSHSVTCHPTEVKFRNLLLAIPHSSVKNCVPLTVKALLPKGPTSKGKKKNERGRTKEKEEKEEEK